MTKKKAKPAAPSAMIECRQVNYGKGGFATYEWSGPRDLVVIKVGAHLKMMLDRGERIRIWRMLEREGFRLTITTECNLTPIDS